MSLKKNGRCSMNLLSGEFSMGKKTTWFGLVKRLFIPKAKSKQEKKSKRWGWVFGRLNLKQFPVIGAPEKTLREATEEQTKHALVVAIATAAAAEAAVAAAHAAAEVVRLTATDVTCELEKRNQTLAAIKIQAVFRAYLARKALRALKGVVRLQAVIRGEILRSRLLTKLKLQFITRTQLQVHQLPVSIVNESGKDGENLESLSKKEESQGRENNLEGRSHRNWDYSLCSKEDMEALWSRKQEAVMKRDRMKQYSFFNRERRNYLTIDESTNKEKERHSHWFERWDEDESHKTREIEKIKSTAHLNLIANGAYRTADLKPRNTYNRSLLEELNSPFSLPRRSFCNEKQKSIGDGSSLPNSPVFPRYMAATESAKAKARSMSTPKQRLGLFDTYADHSSPYKFRLSSFSYFDGEVTDGKNDTSQQKSTTVKGIL